MTALNRKTVAMKRYTTGFAVTMLTLVVTAFFIGCGKKKSAPPPPPPLPAPTVVCPGPGCPQGGDRFLLGGLGYNINLGGKPRMSLELEFYTHGTPSYNSGVYAYGYLRVYVQDCMTCPPVGNYAVRPYQNQPGQIFNNNKSFAVTLEAAGPVGLILDLPNNYILDEVPPAVSYGSGKSYPYTLWNPMHVYSYQNGQFLSTFPLERQPYGISW